jgi:hypothetical protein
MALGQSQRYLYDIVAKTTIKNRFETLGILL